MVAGPLVLWLFLFFGVWPPGVSADDAPIVKSPKAQEDQIRVNADNLVSNADDSYAEFAGNVKVTQGKTIITSDKLRIYYHSENAGDSQVDVAGKETIKKILAVGNVTIRAEDRVAVTPRAEYDAATGIITLSGEGSKVTSGNNTVTGKKITLYRDDDRVTVEGGPKKRVEAVFYPGQKGLDITGGKKKAAPKKK
jgi:lipopolysaccharide export system protein LptA